MSLVSVESSNPTSLIETKKQIILKHLGSLDGKILEKFKKALCQLKPRGGAGPIRMEKLKHKSLKKIVEFIFKYHTERHGTQTVRMTLDKIHDNQTRMLIDRELREASSQRRKSMKPKKNEASTSKVMVDKQGGKQVHTNAPKIMVPIAPRVPCSELSTKKVEREQDRDAVLEAPKNKEVTASKNEGPAHNPPKPAMQRRKSMETETNEASTSKVMVDKQDGKQVHTSAPNIMILIASPVPWSELSAKKVEREKDRGAVLGAPKNREGTASKNEGPARNPPEPATHTRKSTVPKKIEAKKIKIQQDRDAAGVSKNKEGTACKNEGSARNPPEPAKATTTRAAGDQQYKSDMNEVTI